MVSEELAKLRLLMKLLATPISKILTINQFTEMVFACNQRLDHAFTSKLWTFLLN